MNEPKHIVITGGAGYIGSLLTAQLLQTGHKVTVIDNLLFGGESLLAFLSNPNFYFAKADLTEPRSLRDSLPRNWPRLIHEGNWSAMIASSLNIVTSLALLGLLSTGLLLWTRRQLRRPQFHPSGG